MNTMPAKILQLFSSLTVKVKQWGAGWLYITGRKETKQAVAANAIPFPQSKSILKIVNGTNTGKQATLIAKATHGFVVINNTPVKVSDKPDILTTSFAGSNSNFAAKATRPAHSASDFASPITCFVQQANTPAVASTGFVYKTSLPAPKFNGFVLTSNSIVFEVSAFAKATSGFERNSSWFARAANSFAGFFRRIKWKIIRFSKLSDCESTRLNTSPYFLTEDDCYYDSTVIPDFNYHDKWQLLFPDEPDFSLLAWQIEQGIRYSKSNKEHLYGSFFEFNYPLTAGAIRILWQVRSMSPVYGYVPDFRIHTFKHLGKPSSGPSPPYLILYSTAA